MRVKKATEPVGGKVEIQAYPHIRTREAHTSELSEDYVELIADLIEEHGEARVVDIARRIGVTHVTVSKMIQRLQQAGLVESKPYRSVFLSTSGRLLADKAKKRHQIVERFLKALGVSPAIAQTDAEGIEHHVSPETLAAFERFLKKDSRK